MRGRAAHAGLDPEKGANAAVELAHQVLAAAALARPDLGTTVTPTLVAAGTAVNTVPAEASARVDVRVRTESEAGRISAALAALEPVDPGTSVDVERSISIPPLEHGASAALFARAQELAGGLGLATLAEAAVGGGSDGNVLAGLGLQVLDGLGAVGDHAHAEGEYVEVDSSCRARGAGGRARAGSAPMSIARVVACADLYGSFLALGTKRTARRRETVVV